jgi:5'-deoxynucleotidase YfbR-like HD superfamily hydrolase
MNADMIHKSLRVAGSVVRYHTWPVQTKQTVADHTFHLMRIYHFVFAGLQDFDWDDATVAYVLKHDMGEQRVGDLPYPSKKNDPILAARVAVAEQHALDLQDWPESDELTPWQKIGIKICDLLEMAEFALHEMFLGNKYAEPVYQRVTEHVLTGFKDFAELHPEAFNRACNFIRDMERIRRDN